MVQSLLLLSQLFLKRLGWFWVRYPFLLPLLSRHSITLFCGSIDPCWHWYCLSGVWCISEPSKVGVYFCTYFGFFRIFLTFSLPCNYPEDVKESSDLDDFTGKKRSVFSHLGTSGGIWCRFFSLEMPLLLTGTFWWEVTVLWPAGKVLAWCWVYFMGRSVVGS